MLSPTLLIDGIYKSMEGSKASNYVQLLGIERFRYWYGRDVAIAWDDRIGIRQDDRKTDFHQQDDQSQKRNRTR